MSLKAFHIVFVIISTLLCVAFGFWAFDARSAGDDTSLLIAGSASLACSVALVVYGVWFLRKLKGVSYL